MANGLALKRLGETSDVVNLAHFLASDEAARITWESFRVDGGDFLLPALVGRPFRIEEVLS